MTKDSAHHGLQTAGFQYDLPLKFRKFEDFLNVRFSDLYYFHQLTLYFQTTFKLERRNVSVKSEVLAGLVHFLSCLYVLPVVPQQLAKAGYPAASTAVITCACCAIGSILAGLLSNLPFIIAPPTSVSIFLAAFLRGQGMSFKEGNQAVIISGILLIALGYRPLSRFFSRLIPNCIQLGTGIGIGLLTALAGCLEIQLVVKGKYTLVELGDITSEVQIAMAGVMIVAILLYYHVKVAFCVCLVFCSIVYWAESNTFPALIAANPGAPYHSVLIGQSVSQNVVLLFCDLCFLYMVTINGLARAFADLAGVTNDNGAVPRGRWLYMVCGVITIFSGCFGGPPILISPESGAGIKAGGRTGLSAVVGGILFGFATFFTPLFSAVPGAATAPLLIAVGVILFANTKKVDWTAYAYAFPAYIVLFLIPFTYSILKGVLLGWAAYLVITFCTGDLLLSTRHLLQIYAPALNDRLFNDEEVSAPLTDDDTTTAADEKMHDMRMRKTAARKASLLADAADASSTKQRQTMVGALLNFDKDETDDLDESGGVDIFSEASGQDKPVQMTFTRALKISKFMNSGGGNTRASEAASSNGRNAVDVNRASQPTNTVNNNTTDIQLNNMEKSDNNCDKLSSKIITSNPMVSSSADV